MRLSCLLTLVPLIEYDDEKFEKTEIFTPSTRFWFRSKPFDTMEMRNRIKKVFPSPLPDGKKVILLERGEIPFDKDGDGGPIEYTTALNFLLNFKLPPGANDYEKAAIKFIKSIDSGTKVLIIWH